MQLGEHEFEIGVRTYIMGILNVTPDSFSDGGRYNSIQSAVEHALRMQSEGADVIDVGGESTRPGHTEISAGEEVARVVPVIQALASKLKVPISVDTSKAEVARAAVAAGAGMINDVWGFRRDPRLAEVAAETGVGCCLMHNQTGTTYRQLMPEILETLKESLRIAAEAGVTKDQILLDPGIGFGKTVEQNVQVMQQLSELNSLGFPWLLGTSRKSMIGKTLNLPADERIAGTVATTVVGIQAGADFVRVHDVRENSQAARMTDRIIRRPSPHTALIALGSNLGSRLEYLQQALELLQRQTELQVTAVSPVYETDPVGYADQGKFLNAAARLETSLAPETLLQRLMEIEQQLQRRRDIHWGPRTIDLDILFYDQQRISSDDLEIPHPRLSERMFVVAPLHDIAPMWLHPQINVRVFELFEQLKLDLSVPSKYHEGLSAPAGK
ncbi:MAG: dihydropteroate synthase [Spirochaetaceae bacterium]|nr:dihydropteroate synthase [Spirochaetaceae bacterium]MCF7948638.1 dihydropteroate synthase [Spirochaetia bacterium]MCF7950698.1 dihydropteroate synthase [Spirochaetaceae bacterium]